MGGRTEPAAVVVVEELRLVRGHVDADRAVAAAALAGQAEVERVPYLRGPPAVRDHLAGQHLVEQPGAAPGGVRLLPGRPEGGAHDVRTRTRRGRAARGDADTAAYGRGEVTAVVRVAEGHVDGAPGQDREAEVLVETCGAGQDAGVQPAVGVPEVLEAGEQAYHLVPVHPGQQFGPGLPVAVFAAQ